MNYIYFFIFLLLPFLGAAQVEAQFNQAQPSGDVAEAWDITFTNVSGRDYDISFKVMIHHGTKGMVYIANSNTIHLPSNTRVLTSQLLDPIKDEINRLGTDLLPPDDYSFILEAHDEASRVQIVGETKRVTILPPPVIAEITEGHKASQEKPNKSATDRREKFQPPPSSNKQTAKKKKEKKDRKVPIQFSGDGQLTAQYSSRQGTGSFVPPSYFRAVLFPTLTIGELPIGANILLSTEDRAYRQSMNQVSLNFNAAQFQENLRKKLAQKVSQLENGGNQLDMEKAKVFKQQMMEKQFPDLPDMQEQLKDPEILQQIKEIEQLDGLNQVLKTANFKDNTKLLDGLQKEHDINSPEELEANRSRLSTEEYQQMQQLYQFKEQHEQLLQRKADLEQKARKVKKYKAMSNRLRAAEKSNMRSLLSEPKDVKKGMKAFGMANGATKLFSSIRNLGIGTIYPYYTPLSLNGVNISKGVHVEVNPGEIVYFAATYGQLARQALDTSRVVPKFTFDQRLLGLRFGFGSPNKTHLIFSYLQIKDQSDTVFTATDANRVFTPTENYIFGTSMQLSLFKNNFLLGGEINGAIYNRDKMALAPQDNPLEEQDFPFKSMVIDKLNISSAADVAGRGNLDISLFKRATRIKCFASWVGPGYTNLAAPTVLQDLFRWRTELRQYIVGNKVQFTAYASRDINQVVPYTSLYRTEVTSFGGTLRLQFPNAPFVIATYAPYQQNNRNDATAMEFENKSTLLNVLMGHNFRLAKKVLLFIQAGYMRQHFTSPQMNNSYNTNVFSLSQTISAGSAFSFTFQGNYQPKLQIGNISSKVITLDFSGTTTLFKKWSNALGFQYLDQQHFGQRTGFYWRSTYPVLPWADLEVRAQRNIFDDSLDVNGFREVVAFAVLRLRW